MDTSARMSGIFPDAVVLVATVRALKSHAAPKADLSHENVEALRKGLPNLLAHIDHIRNVWKRPVVVALNRFVSDTEAEMALLRQACADAGAPGGALRRLGEGRRRREGAGRRGCAALWTERRSPSRATPTTSPCR